jgi:hypothetical protein
MKRAVRDYNLPGNPVKQIDKPSQRRGRDPVLVTVEVEAMRRWGLERGDRRSATLIGLLAYAGPRPESEALPLRWEAIRRRTILLRATERGVAYSAPPCCSPRSPTACRRGARRPASPPADAPVIPNRRGAVGRARLGQLAQPQVPRRRHGGRSADRHSRRRATRAAARPALELRDAARLRGPAAPVRRRAARPQPGDPPARLRRVWQDFDPSQRASAEEQIERVRRRETGDLGRPGGVRRARAKPRRTGAVPLVFRDDVGPDDLPNNKTPVSGDSP